MGVDAGVLETAVLVAGVAGTAVSAYGAYEQGQANAAAAKYQAQVAANNAAIAEQNAKMATQKGEIEAEQQGLKNRAEMGAITAEQSAGGVDVNTGSAANVKKGQDILGMTDVSQIRQNAAIENYGYRSQKMGYQAQSGLDTAEASNAATAGDIGAVGSLLGGASRVGGQYANWSNVSGGSSSGYANTVDQLNSQGVYGPTNSQGQLLYGD